MIDSRSCHAFSGALGLCKKKDIVRQCQKGREMTTKQKRVLSGRTGSVKTGMPSKEQGQEPKQVEYPFSQHLSRCSAPQIFALTQLQPAGLRRQGQADVEKKGWTVRVRLQAHSRQDVGSTHPVHRIGTQKSKGQPQTGKFSASLCPGTQCTHCTHNI